MKYFNWNSPATSTAEPELRAKQAGSELRQYLETRNERRRLFPRAIAVGLAAGMVGVAFRAVLALGDNLRNALIDWAHRMPFIGWIFPVLFAAIGAGAALAMVRKLAPEAAGSGIPHLEAVLHRHRQLRWATVLPVKFISGALAIGSGMALGREGPTVQMGGAAGMGIAKLMGSDARESLTLAAAGAGAGLAAAFNAPLAGLIFVLEELQKDFRPNVFGAAFLAAAASDVVARLFAGQLPVFIVPAYPSVSLTLLPIFAVLGVATGVLGVAFNRGLIGSLNLFRRVPAKYAIFAAAGVGAVVGAVAFVSPGVVSGGHGLAELAMENKLALTALPGLFLVRYFLTMASYGCGEAGGIFAPLLAMGAIVGGCIGQLAHLIWPGAGIQPGVFAVVGMAAYFTAIVRAPLTGIVLIIEMTASYEQMLPLLISCFTAYIVAEAMGDVPIYEALLQRDLLAGGDEVPLEETMVLELEVQPGSPFAGKPVRELGLPAGVVLVSCREGDREWVPSAAAVIEPHVRVTAVISPDSKGGLEAFRAGCG